MEQPASEGPSTSGDAGATSPGAPGLLRTKSPRWNKSKQQNLKCIADGCGVELTGNYNLRYRLCEEHIRGLFVPHCGKTKRFCQQCSRLHDVSEFDGKRRSCRERLQLHKERQRAKLTKKQPGGSDPSSAEQAAGPSSPAGLEPSCISPPENKSSPRVSFVEEPQIRSFTPDDPVEKAAAVGFAGRTIIVDIMHPDGNETLKRLTAMQLKPHRTMRTLSAGALLSAQDVPVLSGRAITWGGGQEELRRLSDSRGQGTAHDLFAVEGERDCADGELMADARPIGLAPIHTKVLLKQKPPSLVVGGFSGISSDASDSSPAIHAHRGSRSMPASPRSHRLHY